MPCMPARRELHTGRYNFLHQGWCPLEPFDDSMPELLLERQGRLHAPESPTTMHYFEDGGATYHTALQQLALRIAARKATPGSARWPNRPIPETLDRMRMRRRGIAARTIISCGRTGSTAPSWTARKNCNRRRRPFALGRGVPAAQSQRQDDWFLQLETFDPHEPFFTQEHYKDAVSTRATEGPHFDWPNYGRGCRRSPEQMRTFARCEYAALLSMCDRLPGQSAGPDGRA